MDDIKTCLFNKMKLSGRINEMTANFKVMESDELRVSVALAILETFEITPTADQCVKNAKLAVDLKNEANRIFVLSKDNMNQIFQALDMYSKCIALAPNGSQEKSLAYANRSALLYKIHKYEECIEDINRALELEYPEHLIGKLLFRKIDSFTELNQMNKINSTVEEVKQWLQNVSLSIDEKKKFETRLTLETKLTTTPTSASIPKKNSLKPKQKKLPSFARNKEIPCASDALAIDYNEVFGRNIVTTRKVNAGEILIAEKPYATMLSTDEIYFHCSQCLQVSWALIPCDKCIYAMYCSQNCKKAAWQQYHDVECNILGYLISLGFRNNELFSLRLAIIAIKKSGNVQNLKIELDNAENCEGIKLNITT